MPALFMPSYFVPSNVTEFLLGIVSQLPCSLFIFSRTWEPVEK